MQIAITGTSGRVGRALADHFAGRHTVTELPRTRYELGRDRPEDVLGDLQAEVLFNPAGITSLEVCEDDPAAAERANALAPAALAHWCRERGTRLVHFSTDYVFDGQEPGLRSEDHPARPLSVYGLTKRRGEEAVLAAGGTVVRVSWVFGPEKPAFPEALVRQALAGEPLRAVADKFSLPTYTRDLAVWMEALIRQGTPAGLFHACQSGAPASWHDLACETVAFLTESGHLPAGTAVEELPLAGYSGFRAARPRHTAMDTRRLAACTGIPPRPWQQALREHLTAIPALAISR